VLDDLEDLDRRRGEAQWVSRINDALDEDRFFLMAQPIMALADDDGVECFELLLRMSDEDGNVVAPGAFLPAAERYHIMPKVDRWVIRSAIDLIAAAPAATAQRLRCFVNISGQTLADGSLRDFVAEHLARTGVAPQTLCFEITETAAVADFARANAFIQSLTALGCRFALDDFGSGVSSFAYLKNLPVHYLKIDGMFVRDIASDASCRALVRSINEVGHAMGKLTVAECVENDAILACLHEVGVDFVQGFHIGRPQLASDVLARSVPARAVAG
jgi:EAL domain-containing protein (putative c-di-GMP-specific phosphodiesterase class I)